MLNGFVSEDVLTSEQAEHVKELYMVLYCQYEMEHNSYSYFDMHSRSASFLGEE